MENVTLKEYFEKKNITRGEYSDFASECKVSLSYISKMLHNDAAIKLGTPAYYKVKDVLAKDGFNLELKEEAEYVAKNIKMNNQSLKDENKELLAKVAILEEQNYNLSKQVDLMNSCFRYIKMAATTFKRLEENNMKKFISVGNLIEEKINKLGNVTIHMDLDATEEEYLCFGGEAKYELSDRETYDNDVIVAQYGNKFKVADTGKLFGKLLKKISNALPEYSIVTSDIEDVESEMYEGKALKGLSVWEPYSVQLYHGWLIIKFFFAVKNA